MSRDPILVHKEWLGYVQPTGLVVSIPALLEASAVLNQNYGPGHQRFLSAVPHNDDGEPVPEIPDFVHFADQLLNWDTSLLAGAPGSESLPSDLEVNLENYNETLRPTYALRGLDGDGPWLLLVTVLPTGTDLDVPYAQHDRGWQASPQVRFERLLRQTKVSVGLLVNGREIRLVYAPEKELSGHITFKLGEMVQVAGRPILAALQMLLDSERLYSVAEKERLPAILVNSRKYQNVVSTQLAEQVLEALYELLRGFQAANDQLKGELLREVLERDPDHVYGGLLTTLLRLVFVLYAEDRGLLSTDPIYSNYYSVTGLYERLRGDDGRYKDTMDQRYGAWAHLLALFRLIYSGGSHAGMSIPAREGYLFDPDRYLFLEGRHRTTDKPEIPRVPDGVVFRVLSKLLLLDGERLSYRTLAVEQIGSVYEAIMGFELQVAAGQSIAIKPAKRHGAPATINLEELLRTPADKRQKWFTEATDQKLTGQAADALKTASTIEELLVAFDKKIAKTVTPNVVPKGAIIFQPSNERRKSGSHYTPSSLTGPIVEAALEPVLKQLGENPTPEQILNLKVCDPAMGSGAFLVEACRQLGDELMKAWHAHNDVPVLPLDEDEALYAQRVIAQRCLYGVDKNPMAVDLAKLSLWLATLAKNHPFTFIDHSLRHGDSLVGLTRRQIATFHWLDQQSVLLDLERDLRARIERVSQYRQRILAARDDVPYSQLSQELDGAEESLQLAREVGDTVVAAFFSADKPKDREKRRIELRDLTETALPEKNATACDAVEQAVAEFRRGPKGVAPFHWELEFPEVFAAYLKDHEDGGFDVIVGNPPFAGKNTLINANANAFPDWLKQIHPGSHGNADLVAHFYRRAFNLLRPNGCFGLIATNTIGQGDTRGTGLRWICGHDGTIYRAHRNLKWPGQAAVTVSVVHVAKGAMEGPYFIDRHEVPVITAYLFHAGGSDDPAQLTANESTSFIGTYVCGMGFTFDDTDNKGLATPLSEMERLIRDNPKNSTVIYPYIGAEEVNDSPTQSHQRYVINFEDWPLRRERLQQSWADADSDVKKQWLRSGIVPLDYPAPVAADFPELLNIVEQKVKPERLKDKRENYRKYWWQFAERRPGLTSAVAGRTRILANPLVSKHLSFVFLDPRTVLSKQLNVMPLESYAQFAALQSRIHEVWARFFSATLEDRLSYAPSDCFGTFPFPRGSDAHPDMEEAGRAYYECRAEIMQRNNVGLTTLYNWFHDPDTDCRDIPKLRELHLELDHAVIKAYDWTGFNPSPEFIPELSEEDDEEDVNSRVRNNKYHYRWRDDVRDDVLARLLQLNRDRALEEGHIVSAEALTKTAAKTKKTTTKKLKAGKVAHAPIPTLFAKGAGEV